MTPRCLTYHYLSVLGNTLVAPFINICSRWKEVFWQEDTCLTATINCNFSERFSLDTNLNVPCYPSQIVRLIRHCLNKLNEISRRFLSPIRGTSIINILAAASNVGLFLSYEDHLSQGILYYMR